VGAAILNAIWDVVQMCVTMICCCAPIYKILLPKMDLFKVLKSSFRFGSRDSSFWGRSGKKSSSEGSSTDNSGLGAMPPMRNWTYLEGSSQRELAWVETGPYSHDPYGKSFGKPDNDKGYPLQGVQVHRTVDVV
jgi:hypothetical protein